MPATTRYVGLLLMIIGIGSYVLTGRTSVTALIPAFFGVVFVVLAYVARNEAARKHAMHVAVALALVGAIASLGRADSGRDGWTTDAPRGAGANRHGSRDGVLRVDGRAVVHRRAPRAQGVVPHRAHPR